MPATTFVDVSTGHHAVDVAIQLKTDLSETYGIDVTKYLRSTKSDSCKSMLAVARSFEMTVEDLNADVSVNPDIEGQECAMHAGDLAFITLALLLRWIEHSLRLFETPTKY